MATVMRREEIFNRSAGYKTGRKERRRNTLEFSEFSESLRKSGDHRFDAATLLNHASSESTQAYRVSGLSEGHRQQRSGTT
jgi:hypothetical protein